MVIARALNLKIKPATDFSQLAGFYCGIKEMDDFIHQYLEICSTIHLSNTYFVFKGHEIIALFALASGTVELDSEDFDDIQTGARDHMDPLEFTANEEFLENYFYTHTTFPSVELQYLAVKEKYRSDPTANETGLHIGKYIIEAIVEKSKNLYLGSMFITVDAYDTHEYSAVPFYEKCGFGVVSPRSNNDVRRMIKTIWSNETRME